MKWPTFWPKSWIFLSIPLMWGCATVTPVDNTLALSLCLPETAPADLLSWPVKNVNKVWLLTTQDEPEQVSIVFYKRDTLSASVGWYHGSTIMFDADPDGPSPPLVNRRILTDDLKLDTPKGACQWRPLPGTRT
jgi:hypothetical protein